LLGRGGAEARQPSLRWELGEPDRYRDVLARLQDEPAGHVRRLLVCGSAEVLRDYFARDAPLRIDDGLAGEAGACDYGSNSVDHGDERASGARLDLSLRACYPQLSAGGLAGEARVRVEGYCVGVRASARLEIFGKPALRWVAPGAVWQDSDARYRGREDHGAGVYGLDVVVRMLRHRDHLGGRPRVGLG
jgi:hypothetical protein